MNSWRIETKCLHEGYKPGNGEPRVLPIYQSTTYKYDSSEEVAMLFDRPDKGHIYSRISNPTNDALEKKIAALEGCIGAMRAASGQSATFVAVMNICQAGAHIVSSSTIYGGTFNLFNVTLKKMGIDVTFVDQAASEAEIQKAFRHKNKILFGESIANTKIRKLD